MSLPPISFQDSTSSSSFTANLRHGELLAGKVARIESDGNALITFPQGKAVADAKTLFPGEQVLACVRKNNLKVEILLLPSLKPGATCTATVLSSRSSELLVRLGEAELLVKAPPEGELPQPGALVRAQLQMQGGRPVFQMAPAPTPAVENVFPVPGPQLNSLLAPKYLELLNGFLTSAPAMADCLQSLLALLQGLPRSLLKSYPWLDSLTRVLEVMTLNPANEAFGPQLASLIRDSGVFLEARLNAEREQPIQNDLKMALLQAIQEISGEGTEKEASFPPLPDQVLKQTTHLLEMIRGEQILNLRLLPSRQIYIQLPFAQPSGLKMVEILILPEKDARSEKPNQKNAALTIAVSTEKLGKIKTTISIINRVMTCQFKVNHRWVAELIEHHVEGLKRSLEKLDYQVAHIGCGVTSKEGELSVSADLAPFDYIGVNICA